MTEYKQPVCQGTNEKGELQWAFEPMERWQVLQIYAKKYVGQMMAQWWSLWENEKGVEWSKRNEGRKPL